MPVVTVYTQPGCTPCVAAKARLKTRGIEFTERNIRTDADALAELRALGYQSTPVVHAVLDGHEPVHFGASSSGGISTADVDALTALVRG